jgi:hypothetical protein
MSEEDSQRGTRASQPETPDEGAQTASPRKDDRNDEVEGSPVPDPEQPNTEDEDTAAV